MFESIPILVEPNDDDILWRYMDLSKLVSLLGTRALWFARADLLSDRHEGAYGSVNSALRPQAYPGLTPEALADLSHLNRSSRTSIFINCWHKNDYESSAMWSAYARSGEGVAVKVKFGKLRDALVSDYSIHAVNVDYIDPDATWMPEGNVFHPFVYKRRSFEHEREVRFMTYIQPGDPGLPSQWESIPAGVSVRLRMEDLIQEIIVGPDQPTWFGDSVRMVVEAMAPGTSVRHSDLDADPIF